MDILPCWQKELGIIKLNKDGKATARGRFRPDVPDCHQKRITYVSRSREAREMLKKAQESRISHIGLGVLSNFHRHHMAGDSLIPDIRSIRPSLLTLVIAESPTGQQEAFSFYSYVVDLRVKKLGKFVRRLLSLPLCFVGFDLKRVCFCLWRIKMAVPCNLWDILIHEKATTLGQYHFSQKPDGGDDDFIRQIRGKVELRELEEYQLGLPLICQKYGVPYHKNAKFEAAEEANLASIAKGKLTQRQVNYVAKDAVAATEIYPNQINSAVQAGILQHLVTIEMPFVTTMAAIEWEGFRVHKKRADWINRKCKKALERIKRELKKQGIKNPSSHNDLKQFFQKEGLLYLFRLRNKYSFEKEQLKKNAKAHSIIADLVSFRRLRALEKSTSRIIDYAGGGDRIHPHYDQLGAVSGRITSQNPNIIGLDGMLRQLVIPQDGNGIGEADWSQFEVGIASEVYRDKKLIELFNNGDVYAAMAKMFFKNKLSKSDRKLDDQSFKTKFPEYRKSMKVCVLGVIYGMKPSSIAELLHCSISEARDLNRKFSLLFPNLTNNSEKAYRCNQKRGFASTATNLHRYANTQIRKPNGKDNWLVNHPIQGTAASIFKLAATRLHKVYHFYNARIIIPMHDAFVFEAPLATLAVVAKLTEQVMCQVVQEFFPSLMPRVEVDIEEPGCWSQKKKMRLFFKQI